MRSEFENSIKWSSSYEKLVYQHGERLFIFDDDKYKIAAIQLAWELFKNQQAKVDELNQHIKRLESELDSLGSDRQGLVGQVDELQLQLSEDSRILHNVIDIERKKNDELQKRVDASNNVLKSIRKEIEHGHLSEDESQTLSSYANDLEQALKGEQQ